MENFEIIEFLGKVWKKRRCAQYTEKIFLKIHKHDVNKIDFFSYTPKCSIRIKTPQTTKLYAICKLLIEIQTDYFQIPDKVKNLFSSKRIKYGFSTFSVL